MPNVKGKPGAKQASKRSRQASGSAEAAIRITDLVGRPEFKPVNRDILQFDSRKRVTLGGIEVTGEGYKAYVNEDGQILLDPVVTIPAREAWLHQNPTAMAKVQSGLADLAAGRLVDGPNLDDDETDDT